MSSAAPPSIPPRPIRAQAAAAAGASKLPEMPPRPVNKQFGRSVSPANHYPHSPLYEMPSNTNLGRSVSNSQVNNDLPRRPPSVSLPSIGQEGSEYADLHYDDSKPTSTLGVEAAAQTRNVGGDLQLHAPKPSLPTTTAKSQVEAVTNTTSKQAAALGIGKPSTPGNENHEHAPAPLRPKSSFSRPASSASNERRRSIAYNEDHEHEHGPAEQGGMRVPINPLLGDVQAPSPAPFSTDRPATGGLGGEYGSKRHGRTISGREVFLPPGSYGLHGHGVAAQDKFEKDWYAKHPEQYLHDEDQGHYSSIGSGRGEFALSSDDLNQIVRRTASRGAGFGTSASTVTYPDEQIGYLASDQYASRSQQNTPNPNALYKLQSNASQRSIESPLRKTSFPADDTERAEFSKSRDSVSGRSDSVVDSEQDDDVVHIDAPRRHYNKITGGQETIRETEDVRPYATHPTEEGGLVDEHGYSVPILAADEVAREVGNEDMQPAVPPSRDTRRNSAYDEYHGSGDITPASRPGSRPGSIHGGIHGLLPSLSRFTSRHDDFREEMHTPLEDVAEYEPLFPDEDSKQKAVITAERFKRPQTLQHRFPSQDIWEDTPSSAMHMATVSTPDVPAETETSEEPQASKTFESPEVEAARKGEPSEEEKKKLIPNEERLAKSHFAPHLRDDMPTRPGMQPRFPSQDIWEDSPDSQHLVTTVSSHQEEETKSPTETSPVKPSIPPRPTKSRLGDGASSSQKEPSVPARPQKRVYAVPPADAKLTDPATLSSQKQDGTALGEFRKVPSIPDRPKPQVPARPAQKTSMDSLSKTISATSAGSSGSTETEKAGPITSPPSVKPKPQIPARPGQGSKIANLKGNFMNDLNQRLAGGPPKEKEKEPEPEAAQEVKPLEDARKGRARGPQRRAPAKSPSGPAETGTTSTEKKKVRFSLSSPTTVWHIDSADGSVKVHSRPATGSDALPEATEKAKEVAKEAAPIDMSEDKLAQMDHSTPSGAPKDSVAESTTDEGPVEVKTEQVSTQKSADIPSSLAPTGPAKNTAGEPVDPSPLGPSPVHRAEEEIPDPMEKLKEQDFEQQSLSTQTTASTGTASGHTLNRIKAEDHEQGSSLSKHTTADSEASGATLEKQLTAEEPRPANFGTEDVQVPERKVAGGAVAEPKSTLPLPGTDEEKLSGAGTSMPGGFGEPEPESMETEEGSRQSGARDTSTV